MISVYAVIVFMVYGWTLVAFSGRFPSWSRFLPLGEILTVYSYSLLTDFIESLLFLAFLLLLSAILPPRFILEDFPVRGTIITISLLGALMFNLILYTNSNTDAILGLPAWLFITICGLLFMAFMEFLSEKIPLIKVTLVKLPEWLMIFLYAFMGLSLLALVVVAVKNLG
ncbi:hypothetical protein ANAEL_05543 [Anaerolineales bacterium]|nr:hypothetical protein ANAEL_05543 [Anaerolineales bacterium]